MSRILRHRGTVPKARIVVATLVLIAAGVASATTSATSAASAASAASKPSASGTVSSDPVAYAAALHSPDWVKTPNGLMHKSCVHTLPHGATVHGDSVVLASGVRMAPFKPCAYPRLVTIPHAAQAARNEAKRRGGKHIPTTNGWLQASWWDSPDWLSGITSTYTVPSAPNAGGATNFFFSSLEPSAGDSIVQPVLTWGNGEQDYYLTSWYVSGSNAMTGDNVPASPGDTVTASVRATSCSSDGSGCSWQIITQDDQNGQASTLTVASDEAYTSAQGGAFESYGAEDCSMLPSNGSMSFTNIVVYGSDNSQASPSFGPMVVDQECAMSTSADASTTTFTWSPS